MKRVRVVWLDGLGSSHEHVKGLLESMELTRKEMKGKALTHNNDAGSINETM